MHELSVPNILIETLNPAYPQQFPPPITQTPPSLTTTKSTSYMNFHLTSINDTPLTSPPISFDSSTVSIISPPQSYPPSQTTHTTSVPIVTYSPSPMKVSHSCSRYPFLIILSISSLTISSLHNGNSRKYTIKKCRTWILCMLILGVVIKIFILLSSRFQTKIFLVKDTKVTGSFLCGWILQVCYCALIKSSIAGVNFSTKITRIRYVTMTQILFLSCNILVPWPFIKTPMLSIHPHEGSLLWEDKTIQWNKTLWGRVLGAVRLMATWDGNFYYFGDCQNVESLARIGAFVLIISSLLH